MSNAAVATGPVDLTSNELGWQFILSGLGLFVTGFIVGFIPILHYMVGAVAGGVGPNFLSNVTLWWGCPALLAEHTIKFGGLGMMAIGFTYLALNTEQATSTPSRHEQLAPLLCKVGLIAELFTAAVGYVVCNKIWPNFYFDAVPAGKNTWLAMQGVSIAIFVVGVCYASAGIRRAVSQLAKA